MKTLVHNRFTCDPCEISRHTIKPALLVVCGRLGGLNDDDDEIDNGTDE